jgi:hypothetical protein
VRPALRRAAWLLLITGAPLAAWLVRNHLFAGSVLGRQLVWHPAGSREFMLGAATAARWVHPWIGNRTLYRLAVPLFLIELAALAILIYRNPNHLIWLLATMILGFIGFIVASRSLADSYVHLDGRLTLPILVCAIILVMCGIQFRTETNAISAAWRRAGVAVAALFLLGNVSSIATLLLRSRASGFGYSTPRWVNSTALGCLRALPSDATIYTDVPEPIYFFTGRLAMLLPMLKDPDTRRPYARFPIELAAMQHRLGPRGGFIAFFFNDINRKRRVCMPEPAAMAALYRLTLRPIYQTDEAIIYEVPRATLPAPDESRANPSG